MSLMTIFARNILGYFLLFKTTLMRGGVGREQVMSSVSELVTDTYTGSPTPKSSSLWTVSV